MLICENHGNKAKTAKQAGVGVRSQVKFCSGIVIIAIIIIIGIIYELMCSLVVVFFNFNTANNKNGHCANLLLSHTESIHILCGIQQINSGCFIYIRCLVALIGCTSKHFLYSILYNFHFITCLCCVHVSWFCFGSTPY